MSKKKTKSDARREQIVQHPDDGNAENDTRRSFPAGAEGVDQVDGDPDANAEKVDQVDGDPNVGDELAELSATEILMDLAYTAWLEERLKPVLHFMTRTFAHWRAGEKYDTDKIFDQLMMVNNGNHGKFLKQAQAFHEIVRADLAAYLAELEKTS
jgi:hypothetical protein